MAHYMMWASVAIVFVPVTVVLLLPASRSVMWHWSEVFVWFCCSGLHLHSLITATSELLACLSKDCSRPCIKFLLGLKFCTLDL